MRRLLISISILVLFSSACSSRSGNASGGEISADERATDLANLPYRGFSTRGLEAYAATYEIRFEGSYTWTYVLKTRSDGKVTEYRLEYIGVDPSNYSGAVRMVTDGVTSRMIGPGTDNECFLFPSDFDTKLSFFNPDDMLDPFLANEGLQEVGIDSIAGLQANHYSAQNDLLGKWEDVQVDIWVFQSGNATMLYEMKASGPDPLFDAGDGIISTNYLVKEIADQNIEPITGCTIPVPLPENASKVVKFPGLVSFDSPSTAQEMVAFYQSALPLDGWQEANPLELGEDAVLMSYRRGEEVIQINIEVQGSGVNVEILIQ